MKFWSHLTTTSKLVLLGAVIYTVLIVTLAVRLSRPSHPSKPAPAPVVAPPNTTVTTVDKIEAKQLAHDPADIAQINALLKEVASLKAKPVIAAVTTSELNVSGKLEMRPATPAAYPSVDPTVVEVKKIMAFTAEDFRLKIAGDENGHIDYTLHQKFQTLAVTGRHADGKQFLDIHMFEVTPSGNQEIPSNTVESVVDETRPHWMAGLSLQAGFSGAVGQPSAFLVGAQWLKHGRTDNPRDLAFAVATPVVTFPKGRPAFGVLPVSVNVAHLVPHQPTTNVWVSPLVGLNLAPAGVGAIGIAGTFTF